MTSATAERMRTCQAISHTLFSPMWVLLLWFLAISAIYWAIYLILMRYPLFIHSTVRPLPFARPYLHIAHRGGGGEEPENTLRAFRAAVGHKVDVLELDVRQTLDGVIVIAHDPDFQRVALGISSPISETNFVDLPLIHGHEQVCKLEDLLDDPVCKDTPISLDFKVAPGDMIQRVWRMFHSRGRRNLLVWGSFSETIRLECRRLFPQIPTFCSLRQTMTLYLFFLVGLLPFVPIDSSLLATVLLREQWLEVFVNQDHAFPLNWILKTMHRLGGFRFFTWLIEHPSFVRHLRARGMAVAFWTANSKSDLVRVRRSGASGHITDFPSQNLHLD